MHGGSIMLCDVSAGGNTSSLEKVNEKMMEGSEFLNFTSD